MGFVSHFRLLISMFFCLNTLCFSQSLFAEEKLFYLLDDREWKIGYQKIHGEEEILEMVLVNDSISNWSELVTIQSIPDSPLTEKQVMEAVAQQSKKKNSSAEYTPHFKVLENKKFYMWEHAFKGSGKKIHSEYEIARVIKGKNNMYTLHYASKNKENFEKVREEWIARFQEAYIAEHRIKQGKSIGHWLAFSNGGDSPEKGQKLMYQPESNVYTDKKTGFSIPLSAEWFIQPIEDFIPDEAEKVYYDTAVLIFGNPEGSSFGAVAFCDLNTKESKKIQQDCWKKHQEKFVVVKESDLRLASGDKGHYLILSKSNPLTTGYVTFFEKNNRLFRLELWANSDRFYQLQDEFKDIIHNFTLLDF